MNPLLGIAFGLLLVKALLGSEEPPARAPTREDETPEARRVRIARRKARREAREAKNSKPNSDPGSGNDPAT